MLTTNIKTMLPTAIRLQLRSPAIYPVLGQMARHLARDYARVSSRNLSSVTPTVAKKPTAHPVTSLLRDLDFFPSKSPFFSSPLFNSDLAPLLKEMDWIDKFRTDNYFPKYDVHTDRNKVSLKVDLPGVKKDDVHVEVKDDKLLHINGQRKIEAEDGTLAEIKFDKQFTFGDSVDTSQIIANLADGVLKVTLPKLPTAPENIKKIDIQTRSE